MSALEKSAFIKSLETATRGETIKLALKRFLEEEERNIPLTNIMACVTDGAPAVIGKHKGYGSLRS